LCIQRPFGNLTDDPLCPTKNRPLRDDGSAHTMITFLPESERTADDPDPNFFMPLAVGDYITVLGQEVDGGLFEIFDLIANIGVFTPAGEQPTYMYIARGQFAISGPAEAEDGETRAVVSTTDVVTPITWSSLQLGPCTGATTWQALLTEQPLDNAAGQQPGKTIFRGGSIDFTPCPRWIGFKTESGMKVTNNSIVAGVYINPVNGFANGFTFAEVTVYGDQEFELEFLNMPFLAQGSGPYVEGLPLVQPMTNPPIIGQLDPWPGTAVPTTANCATVVSSATVSSASPTSTVTLPRDTVTITGITTLRTRGETAYTVTAVSTQIEFPFAVLTLTATSDNNPVGGIIMVDLGDGSYTLTFSTHNNLLTITVTSSLGGSTTEDV